MIKHEKIVFITSLFLAALFFQACNDGEKDSVEQANEANENKDTLNGNNNTTHTNLAGEEDSKFMVDAASGAMMEVEAGNLAQQKGKNPRVKSFAAMLIQDHNKANTELKTLASLKNVTLPGSMGEDHVKHINKLKEKSGAEFDNAFMSMMVDDHEKDIKKFEQCTNDSRDADIKAFTSKTLPVLRMHLDSAKAIKDAVKN